MITISVYGTNEKDAEQGISIIAKAAVLSDFQVQSLFFPSPDHVWGAVKIDKGHILSKDVGMSDIAIVLETRLNIKRLSQGFKDNSIVIFNSPEKLSFPWLKKRRIKAYGLDASAISTGVLKKHMPCVPAAGAVAKYFNKITLKSMKSAAEHVSKEAVLAVEEGYKAVR